MPRCIPRHDVAFSSIASATLIITPNFATSLWTVFFTFHHISSFQAYRHQQAFDFYFSPQASSHIITNKMNQNNDNSTIIIDSPKQSSNRRGSHRSDRTRNVKGLGQQMATSTDSLDSISSETSTTSAISFESSPDLFFQELSSLVDLDSSTAVSYDNIDLAVNRVQSRLLDKQSTSRAAVSFRQCQPSAFPVRPILVATSSAARRTSAASAPPCPSPGILTGWAWPAPAKATP